MPFFVWNYAGFITSYVSLFLFFLLIFYCDYKDRYVRCILLIFVLSYLFLSSGRGASPIGTLTYLSFAFVPCLKENLITNVYKYYKLFYVVIISCSILSLLLFLLHIPVPSSFIDPLNTVKDFQYLQIGCLVMPANAADQDFMRFCGPFDEPGVVGTLSALFLFVERFNLARKDNIIILISGILSLSLFFYLIIYIYLFLSVSFRYKILIVGCIGLLYCLTYDLEYFSEKIWNRLEYDPEVGIVGNNREADGFDEFYKISKNSIDYYFGYGVKYVERYEESASIRVAILRDGLLSVMFNIIGFVLLAFSKIKNKNNLLLFVVILLLTLYQRPGFCSYEFLMLFTLIIITYKNASISRRSVV